MNSVGYKKSKGQSKICCQIFDQPLVLNSNLLLCLRKSLSHLRRNTSTHIFKFKTGLGDELFKSAINQGIGMTELMRTTKRMNAWGYPLAFTLETVQDEHLELHQETSQAARPTFLYTFLLVKCPWAM